MTTLTYITALRTVHRRTYACALRPALRDGLRDSEEEHHHPTTPSRLRRLHYTAEVPLPMICLVPAARAESIAT